ncbi:DNA recombination protein RmuC [Thermogymnomonas acidicola]|uniref:DNA recombination protein RmuC n=1 Tax=Thermogymnomonas acidicola TaxID=399579 RepID=UPI00139695D6|nr:DNA recombination protein RmuC [Thermogymnomonas acidicola]
MLTYTYASIFLAGFALGIVAGTVLYQRLSRRQYERAIRDTTQELYQRVVQEGAKAIAESAKASMEDVSRETRHALELEKTEIKDMIEPVRQVLEAYRQEVSAFRSSVQQNYGEVTQMMRALEEAGRRLSEETRNLASALKNNQARGGRWGGKYSSEGSLKRPECLSTVTLRSRWLARVTGPIW